MQILVTGGAGFIGSHLVTALTKKGHSVRIVDALIEQVHGVDPIARLSVMHGTEFIRGDVRDQRIWQQALAGCEVVYHLAAEVGVGQSMYDIVRYMSANTMGTANLLELLASGEFTPQKVIVASSMSIYGEGAYHCPHCGPVAAPPRSTKQLQQQQWEPFCPQCGTVLTPMPTPETKALQPTSVYAISKRDQEELCLSIGRAYGIPTVALRFFNAYGSGQSLSNPYTGVASIFASRLLNNNRPLVFEDGNQMRDFVHVSDVVQALILALEKDAANYEVFNVGSGVPVSISEVAKELSIVLNADLQPKVTHQFREGDIRHCFADISKAGAMLDYSPRVSFIDGMAELISWVKQQTAVDRVEQAQLELTKRGLAK